MTRLSSSVSRSPVRLLSTSNEDRRTYRKWVRISLTCYFVLIGGLIIVSLTVRGTTVQTMSEGQTAGIGTAKSVRNNHPGG